MGTESQAVLHTVSKSPFENQALASCLRLASSGDTVLLIEDSVYAAASGTGLSATVSAAMASLNFCALGADLEARGVASSGVIPGVKVVDYAGFVDLVVGHKHVHAWY